ncbi:hypothetical protein LguiA_008603 [Lonicera macranthoides]
MGTMWNVVLGFKATIVIVVVQIMFAGANVLYKLAANDGMIVRIMVAYRSIFAAAFMHEEAKNDMDDSPPIILSWVIKCRQRGKIQTIQLDHLSWRLSSKSIIGEEGPGYGARAYFRNLSCSGSILHDSLAYYESTSYEPIRDRANIRR